MTDNLKTSFHEVESSIREYGNTLTLHKKFVKQGALSLTLCDVDIFRTYLLRVKSLPTLNDTVFVVSLVG